MKKIILKLIFVSLIFSSCAVFQNKNTPEKLKKEALEFSLEFVENVFAQDCEKVFLKFNDKILSLEDDKIFEKIIFKEEICAALKSANRNTKKTFSNYLADYKTEILTLSEFQKKFDFDLPKLYTPLENDYFFVGAELKSPFQNSYINDDLFLFLVRKENKKWSIIGAGG